MRPLMALTHHTADELVAIVKEWYTTQRGRIIGNTVSWDELSLDVQQNIMDSALEVLELMEEAWQWERDLSLVKSN